MEETERTAHTTMGAGRHTRRVKRVMATEREMRIADVRLCRSDSGCDGQTFGFAMLRGAGHFTCCQRPLD